MYMYAVSKPPKLDMHTHSYYEILYFNSGDACYMIGDKTYHAESGDIFVKEPGENHCIIFNSDIEYKRHFVQISERMMNTIPYEIRENIVDFICCGHGHIPAFLVKKYRLGSYYQLINYNIAGKKPLSSFNDFMVRTYIMQLAAVLGAIPREEILNFSEEKPVITEIKTFINDNTSEILSLDNIAERFYMSKYYMCHMFRDETGMTIKDYIAAQKIAKACELMRNGVVASEVQKLCGFNDYSTFYRTFKKYMGISPTEF